VKHRALWRGEVPSSGTSILRWWAASSRGISVEVVATKEGATGLFGLKLWGDQNFWSVSRDSSDGRSAIIRVALQVGFHAHQASASVGTSGRNREGRPSERAPFGRLRSGQPLPAPAIESRRSPSGGPHPLCENTSILLNRS
jgi:hypothetical protein